MCGICGKVYRDAARRVTASEVVTMRDSMQHRGPDAGGLHLDRHAGLGHRRLSVIDLEASAQPMPNAAGNVWISYNGEVYNFAELRAQLVARGHTFRTSGDTEVILHLYEEYGAECVKHLRGMFAFAIWDARDDSLFLARDRIGVKPLYYALTDEALLFGSELKALLADPQFRSSRAIDPLAVHGYLSFLSVPDPLCIYRGVHKLPAAHTLTYRQGRVELRRYWNVTFQQETGRDEASWREELLERLKEAVRIRLVSDVPLGAFLSGGIDSSTVVALMAKLMNRPVKTFSIGFADREFNEASDARLVAQHLGTDHTELILSPSDALPHIGRLLTQFDEPYADSSAIPTHYVSALAREQVTVSLSGDGGDELFGGYPWRQLRPTYQRLISELPSSLRHGIAGLARALPTAIPGSNFLRRADAPYAEYVLDAMAVFDVEDRRGLYSNPVAAAVAGTSPYAHHLPNLAGSDRRDWPERMMEYDLKTYLPNDVLTKVDRMSMLNSLEAREPLLDHPLVEFAARMPWSLKLRGGVSKHILKTVIAPYLPAEVLTKPKQGFSVPLATWLRTSFRQQVLDTLRSGNRHGLFQRARLDAITDAFYQGDERRNHQIWTLFAFEHWYQEVDRRADVGTSALAAHGS
ncbi:MAG: asparagine synthase (glutamine-hydrolyzing) [Proteobacteria bacterium]|nr:asparagine synthase (glutamine-hydrolyzing) [Pseudomonadota bacterium]